MQPAQRGMSLIEVVIAMAIFMTVMVAALESMTASQSLSALGEAQDELTTEGMRVLDEISLDLTSSGWLLPCATGSSAPVAPADSSFTVAGDDRKIRYYPYVQIQETAAGLDQGLGELFTHTWRSASLAGPVIPAEVAPFLRGLPADRTRLFTLDHRDDYQASYFARSQELIFLKASVAGWDHVNDQPSQQSGPQPALWFGGSRQDWASQSAVAADEEAKRKRMRVLYASGWAPTYTGGEISGYAARKVYGYAAGVAGVEIGTTSTIPYGVVMESGYLADSADLAAITVNWRTMDGGGYAAGQQGLDDLSEYMYAVVPSANGLGRLVRAHSATAIAATFPAYPDAGSPISSSGTRSMVVEKVLSDNVVRIVFDTWRTVDQQSSVPDPYEVTTLDVNMLRVRLYMVRRVQGTSTVLSRTIDRVITMRARNSHKDKDFDEAGSSAAILGRQPIGITF